jgi:hypothetical protein
MRKKKVMTVKQFLARLRKTAGKVKWFLKEASTYGGMKIRVVDDMPSVAACPLEFLGKENYLEAARKLGLTPRGAGAIIHAADQLPPYSESLRRSLLQATGLKEKE